MKLELNISENELDLFLTKVRELFAKKGYSFFTKGVYNLNIIGIRSNNAEPNRFDDMIIVLYRDEEFNWQIFKAEATTDPGRYWLLNPMNIDGTAILTEGQHKGAWVIGLHKGKYKALVQRTNEVTVYRDRNRDNKLDFDKNSIQSGYFGINIHRASKIHLTLHVDKWSAGCQVIQDSEKFDEFISLCKKQVTHTGYKTFSYTIINEEDLA